MTPRPLDPKSQADQPHDGCPLLLDLAALGEGHLRGDELERVEAHVARCAQCLALVRGLRAEMRDADEAARLTLVPTHVLQAAMNLRLRDGVGIDAGEIIATDSRGARLWTIGARRGLGAAAMLGIVIGGYYVGQSFNNAGAEPQPGDVAANGEVDADSVTFGLLDVTSAATDDSTNQDDDGFGLFALALKEGQS